MRHQHRPPRRRRHPRPRPHRLLRQRPARFHVPPVRATGPRSAATPAPGNGDGQRAVTEWDVASGKNIKWKTPIPGIANSSPIVWGNRVFATTAISKAGDNTFRTGLYGDVKPVDDLSPHEWKIYCLDKATGKILWERTAATGAPKTKRHTKSSQASSTPVTDGRRVVALFGSAGMLVAWDFNGKELWRVNLGTLDSGWFFDPAFQWGHSSSPIIYRNSVILQADVQKGSYIAAWDLATGKQLWKTARADEISTWGTPTIVRATPTAATSSSPTARRSAATIPRPASSCGRSARTPRSPIGTPVAGNGARLRHRRLSAGASDLRDPAGRGRRHLAAEGTGIEPDDRVEQHDRGHLHPDAAALRRVSVHAEHQRRRHAPTIRRPASARSAVASAGAARSPRRRSAPTAVSTSRARTARCTSSRRRRS